MMFVEDVIAWALAEQGTHCREVHLLKDRSLLMGPIITKREWEAGQRAMFVPYPRHLRKPVDILLQEAARQERLAV